LRASPMPVAIGIDTNGFAWLASVSGSKPTDSPPGAC
jgi:hypothetical protein